MESNINIISFIFVVLSVVMYAKAQNTPPPFPTIEQIMKEFYQTKVTVTDIEEGVISTATEYFDNSGPRGRVDYLTIGNRNSVIYTSDTGEILNINATTCHAGDIETADEDFFPLFYGWLNKKPLIIGPSAPLWYAQDNRDKIVTLKTKTSIRKIDCWKYSLNITGARENVTIDYYIATAKWTTAYQFSGLRVPVRISISGTSSKYSEKADQVAKINLITDFAYFKPTLDNFLVFRPPLGVGCKLKKPTREMKKVPKVFQYSAEVYDVLQADQQEISNIEHQEVWYDSTQKIARLDQQKARGSSRELFDFNNGVTYSIIDERTCTIKPLQKSIFEGHSNNRLIGQMKEPNEVMNFDGTFYYMGQRLMRGIRCDTFESLQENVVFMDQTLAKLVVTAYYTDDSNKVIVNGEEEPQIPVAYTVTGWDTATTKSIEMQYSIFEFNDVIWPSIHESFDLPRCFPSTNDKSYFLLILDVTPELSAKMAEKDNLIVEELRGKIIDIAKLPSGLRLPFLKVDYKESGVYVTGLMLDRPPAIRQFFMEYEGDVIAVDNYLKPALEADTTEKCAYACVDNGDFACTGFYMCNQACFMKSKDILEPTDKDERKTELGVCQTWLRATRDSQNEGYLLDSLQKLDKAVADGSFSIVIPLSDREEIKVPVKDIVVGGGPFTGDKTADKPFTRVIEFAKLRAEDKTTSEVSDVDNLNDCYRKCKDSDSMSCSSFSYCPDSRNKQCMISSTLVINRKSNPDDTVDDRNCYVYSLKYLELFDKYPGKTLPLGGDVGFPKISTPEECAQKCKETKTLAKADYRCRGFEYCRSGKTCVLHSKHVMDLKPGDITEEAKPSCTHYAARFSADYFDLGYTLIEDFNSNERTEISLEECAKVCSMELKQNCSSFNYCPASEPGATNSKCYPSSLTLKDKGIRTLTKDKCHHFEKKSAVDDWTIPDTKSTAQPPPTVTTPKSEVTSPNSEVTSPNSEVTSPNSEVTSPNSEVTSPKSEVTSPKSEVTSPKSEVTSPKSEVTSPRPIIKKLTVSKEGYTSKGFTGLVIGMLAFGMCVGVLGFVGFSYYKSRRSGDGFSVRFSKT